MYASIVTIAGHAWLLKVTGLVLLLSWALLLWEFPATGEHPLPKWWTAVYALGKVMLGVCAAHLTIELFPFVRLADLLRDYQQARVIGDGPVALAAAVAYAGSVLAVALVAAVIIYSVAAW